MKYIINHIETDQEVYIKFTIWNQTFTLAPFIRDKDDEIKKSQIDFYYRTISNGLDNLINNK